MKLSVIIPCYNELKTIGTLVQMVRDAPYQPKEIIVVDDCSTDGTRELLMNGGVAGIDRLILQETNQGKGAAVRSGFRAATGDVVVIQDADLEYDPTDYGKLIQPILAAKPTWFSVRGSSAGPTPSALFLAPRRQWHSHRPLKYVLQSQSH